MKHRKDLWIGFKNICRKSGLKLTPQRLEIYAELAKASDHPSPERLHQRLVKRLPSISLDTVYRTLTRFERHGIVQKVETVQSQVRYEAVRGHHHHLICKQCHEIMDFPWPSFDAARLPKKLNSWGKIERKSVVAYGICGRCRKRQDRRRLGEAQSIRNQSRI